jgi:diadenylate cyclase
MLKATYFFFSSLHWTDYVDVLVVSWVIYSLVALLSGTRAANLLKGLGFVFLLRIMTQKLSLYSLEWLLQAFMTVGILAVIIIFQPELRKALEQLGRGGLLRSKIPEAEIAWLVKELHNALHRLSRSKTGALIVIERQTGLKDLVESGITLDAQISAELLLTIFAKLTPLHDGAVIVAHNRLEAASCFLPLSQNYDIARDFGTRHRAALGITEISDAVALVASEETGLISWVEGGVIERNLPDEVLRERLTRLFLTEESTLMALGDLRRAMQG